MEAVMKAEGLSMDGLGSETSGLSSDRPARKPRRMKKNASAAAVRTKSTNMSPAAVHPRRNDDPWGYAQAAAKIAAAALDMCERAVPIQSGRAKKDHQDCPGSQKSSKRQLEIASLAPDGDHGHANQASEQRS